MFTTFGTLSLTLLCVIAALYVSNVEASDLKSDYLEFKALIPRRRIKYIAARHFLLDKKFRTALTFIRAPGFTDTWQQMRSTPEIKNIMTHLTSSGTVYDVANAIDNLPNKLRSFQIPSKVPVKMMLPRTFTSFLKEVLNVLPRAKMTSLMASKVKENGEFAHLYKTVKSKEFHKLVHTARNSSNLAASIKTLEQNSINVDDILNISQTILSWGP